MYYTALLRAVDSPIGTVLTTPQAACVAIAILIRYPGAQTRVDWIVDRSGGSDSSKLEQVERANNAQCPLHLVRAGSAMHTDYSNDHTDYRLSIHLDTWGLRHFLGHLDT
jgi:hypothetical protein